MPQRAHSHQQHSPTRGITQEFLVFIRHPEPQLKGCHSEPQLKECHVLNPYHEPQLKEYIPSHNSRNTSKPTLEISYKPCRPRTSKASKTQVWSPYYHLALLKNRQAKFISKSPSRRHVPLGAKRLCYHSACRCRLAGRSPPPGATCPISL